MSEKYNSGEIKIIFSTVERTQMNLSSHLQRLYPPNENLSEVLNEKQLINSAPPVNINDTRIQKEKSELEKYSLPNSKVLIPFEIVDISG